MREPKATESTRVPRAILDRVRRLAEQERRPLSTQIEILLEHALQNFTQTGGDTGQAAA